MIRVWFNHWFSTVYNLIEQIKEGEAQIHVVGSNKQKNSVIQKVCDEWYEEPELNGEEYISYCLEFCRQHDIDVFVPRRNMVDISKNLPRFQELGVKVMVDDYEIISLLNNKASAYEYLRDCEGVHIPAYAIVNSCEKFEEVYQKLRKDYDRICIKFVKDEGGLSFRKVEENIDRFAGLRRYQGAEIAYDMLKDALSEEKHFDDLMVMPYLPGDEISVDCLNTNQGLIAIPRVKGPARHENVVFDTQILDMTKSIMEKINLQYPCNIQFKRKDEIPYLLEINTRMSGGLQMGCLAAGVNIPGIALYKLLGKNREWKLDVGEKIVSYMEIPKLL